MQINAEHEATMKLNQITVITISSESVIEIKNLTLMYLLLPVSVFVLESTSLFFAVAITQLHPGIS